MIGNGIRLSSSVAAHKLADCPPSVAASDRIPGRMLLDKTNNISLCLGSLRGTYQTLDPDLPPTMTTILVRPDILYAWKGPSLSSRTPAAGAGMTRPSAAIISAKPGFFGRPGPRSVGNSRG